MSAQLLWRRTNTQNIIFLNLINSIDNTKSSWYTLPHRQHHSFFRNFTIIVIESQLHVELKKDNNNKNHQDSQRLTKCDPPYDFRDKGDNTHTTHQHILQNAHCSRNIY